MTLSDWLSEDGRKAIEAMGYPRYDRGRLVLCHSEETEDKDEHWFLMGGAEGPTDLPLGVALALLRDWAREWLMRSSIEVRGECPDNKSVSAFYGWDILNGAHKSRTALFFNDYDAALIAAVLATKEAGHDA